MDEVFQDNQEQENLSGFDLAESWYHEESMRTETLCDMDDEAGKQTNTEK